MQEAQEFKALSDKVTTGRSRGHDGGGPRLPKRKSAAASDTRGKRRQGSPPHSGHGVGGGSVVMPAAAENGAGGGGTSGGRKKRHSVESGGSASAVSRRRSVRKNKNGARVSGGGGARKSASERQDEMEGEGAAARTEANKAAEERIVSRRLELAAQALSNSGPVNGAVEAEQQHKGVKGSEETLVAAEKGDKETAEARNPQIIARAVSQGDASIPSEGNFVQSQGELLPQGGQASPNQRQQEQQHPVDSVRSDDTSAADGVNKKKRDTTSATVHKDAVMPAVEGEDATVHSGAAPVVESGRGGGGGVGGGAENGGSEHPSSSSCSLPREQGSPFEPWPHEEGASSMGSPSGHLGSPSGLERTGYIDGRLGELSPGTYSADSEFFEEEQHHEGRASAQTEKKYAEHGKAIEQTVQGKRHVGIDDISMETFVPSERTLAAYCQVTKAAIKTSKYTFRSVETMRDNFGSLSRMLRT